MESDLEKAINEINLQLHQFTAVRQETSDLEGLAAGAREKGLHVVTYVSAICDTRGGWNKKITN